MRFPPAMDRPASTLYEPFTPEDQKDPLPVLVNFHGGGFVKGYQAKCITFGRILAREGTLPCL